MKIRYLVMDVDGTLTDGKIYMGKKGELFKAFNIKDGYGLHTLARKHGIEPVVITGRRSTIVTKRCEELNIEFVFQGITNKLDVLNSITCDMSSIAYIGDDLNDLLTIQAVNGGSGITGCPNDAVEDVKRSVSYISRFDGGCGAVRDFLHWIIDYNDRQ